MTEFRLPAARADFIGLALAADGPAVTACWRTPSAPASVTRWPRPGDPPAWQLTHAALSGPSADGEWSAVYERRAAEVRVYRVGADPPGAVLPCRHPDPHLWSAVAPGGGEVAWVSRGRLFVRRLPGGEPVAEVRCGQMYGLAFSPNGRWLTGIGERVVRVYDRSAGYAARRFEVGRYTRVAAADGPTAVAIDPGTASVTVWDLTGPRPAAVLPVPGQVSAVAVSADGRRVLTGSLTGDVTLWDAAGGVLTEYAWGLTADALAFAPDRLTAAAGGSDGRVVVWDLDA